MEKKTHKTNKNWRGVTEIILTDYIVRGLADGMHRWKH